MITKRLLGRTGMNVTAISFGGLPMQRCSIPEAVTVLEAALDAGINFIDTARAYTDSEIKIGQISHLRSKFYLATKSMARDAINMSNDIETSLKNMKTDYIDLYQVHNTSAQGQLDAVLAPGGALEALKAAKKAGKIKHIGITGHIHSVLINAIKTGEFDTVQVPYNFVEQTPTDIIFPLARKHNMGIIIMKPLGGGQFSNIELSLRFILQQPDVVLIPGMDTIEHVQQNLSVFYPEYKPLNEQELQILHAESTLIGKDFCRRCGYCMPCPHGVDIPQNFIFKIQYERYGMTEAIPKRYAAISGKASKCVGCGVCESKCPYQLPIRKRLADFRNSMGD